MTGTTCFLSLSIDVRKASGFLFCRVVAYINVSPKVAYFSSSMICRQQPATTTARKQNSILFLFCCTE